MNQNNDNIVFMPQTIEHYESELASYLSLEQYEESAEVLQFLLRYSNVDVERRQQWEQLLAWLHMMFPEILLSNGKESFNNEQTEDQLRIQTLGDKWSSSPVNIVELLHTLEDSSSPEKQLILLEQLAYHGGSTVISGVRKWLTEREMPPLLQFKAMQTLKRAGDLQEIDFSRSGQIIRANPINFPLELNEIPPGIELIFQRIKSVCESSEPIIGEFASQMQWDVIATSCGMALYQEMSSVSRPLEASLWASTLHALLELHIFGSCDEEKVRNQYDISNNQIEVWEQIYEKCRVFLVI